MTQTRGWRLVLAQRAGVPASVRRFAKRARRRRLRTAVPWLVGLLVLVLAGVGAGLIYGTSVVGVDHVRVTGVRVLTADAVRVAAGVRRGTPLARLDEDRVARRVRMLPPVREVSVGRDLPDTLVIRVLERSPTAVVPQAEGFTLLDEQGVAYLPVADRPPELPVVRLATPAPEDASTRAALTVLAALPPEVRAPMVALVAEAPTRIRLELTHERVVVWGDATENAAKVRIVMSQLGASAKVLDVSAPGVVTFR